MHDTALAFGKVFFEIYGNNNPAIILEMGSQDVNGALRTVAPAASTFIGLDLEHGRGVDMVIDPDAPLPIRDNFADLIVSSSQFEHDSFFWQTFLEFCRVVKSDGYIYINAPSNGVFHRYPQDVWRFYPDAGRVLERWAVKNGYEIRLVESFIGLRRGDMWNDFTAVFKKGPGEIKLDRLISDSVACCNISTFRSLDYREHREASEDMEIMTRLRQENEALKSMVAKLQEELDQSKAASAAIGNVRGPAIDAEPAVEVEQTAEHNSDDHAIALAMDMTESRAQPEQIPA